MSTGVCIINRNGIALAADSAGTYTSDTGSQMFYNSMDKVFSLSDKNVCGAIAYGNMSLYNVSVEQILGEFRQYIDDQQPFDDLFDIWTQFQNFIREKYEYYKFDEAERKYCQGLFRTVINTWGKKIKDAISCADADIQIGSILDNLRIYIAPTDKVPGFDIVQYLQSEYIGMYQQEIDAIVPELKQYPDLYSRFGELLCEYFHLLLEKESRNVTGIFFAGYGKADAFPKCLHIEIHKLFKKDIKFVEKKRFVGNGINAEIIPLAQREVIFTFCKGISSEFTEAIPQKANELMMAQVDALSSSDFSDEQKKMLKVELSKCKKQISDAISAEIQSRNVQPIIDSVKLIALPEMAFLAESLVNITTLKRTYALDGKQQTVGGPTDVAVLSKAGGFCWVKQKHGISRTHS